MYGNGKHALADALDICTAELEQLIDRRFAVNRVLLVEPEGTNWTASIGDVVLYRHRDKARVLRFARTFAERERGITVEMVPDEAWSVRVDNVVAIR